MHNRQLLQYMAASRHRAVRDNNEGESESILPIPLSAIIATKLHVFLIYKMDLLLG